MGKLRCFEWMAERYLRKRSAMVEAVPHIPTLSLNIGLKQIFIMRFSLSAVALLVAAVAAVDISGAPACAVS